jgi:large subunit ribosomal protein L25
MEKMKMATTFVLNAEPRNDLGKGASRRLRRDGKVPAILYGANLAPQALSLMHNEILRNLDHEAFYSQVLTVKVGGEESRAVLRDMQRHPSRPVVQHVDLLRVSEHEEIRVHIPLHFINEERCPGLKAGGLATHDLIEVEVECLPKHLPEYIEADMSGLRIGDSLHLSDLALPQGVILVDLERGEGHDLQVASIHSRLAVTETEEGAGEGAEGGPEAAGI